MTSLELFKNRCLDNFRFQSRTLRMGIDWTVLIYLIVPAVIFAIVVYRSWWRELPAWMEALTFDGWLFLFYVFSWFGAIRLFIEEADQLFLLQNRAFYRSLRKWGIAYSLGKQVILTSLFLLVCLPYLIKFQFTHGQLLQLFFALALWKMAFLLIKDICFYVIAKRWLRIFVFIILFIAGFEIFLFFMSEFVRLFFFSILLLIVLIVLFRWKAAASRYFYTEAEREFDAKYQIANFMLVYAGAIEKRSAKQRKKPWIFRRSQRLFSHRESDSVMLEQYIKIWIRKPQRIFSYFRFLSVSAVALFLFPNNWSIVLVLLIVFLCYQMVRAEWDSYAKSQFIQMMARDFDMLMFVRIKVICLFSLPIYTLVFIVYGLTTSNWLSALIVFAFVAMILFFPWMRYQWQRN